MEKLDLETSKSLAWNKPEMLFRVESGRYLYERALGKIISDVFTQYIPEGTDVFEVGAGSGYLKTLVPEKYYPGYISSDYNIDNLRFGQGLRKLNIRQASACDLPLEDSSQSCVVSMDTYDTLHNLGKAMGQIRRFLVPGGKFIHFQVNYPSDDTVEEEYPNHIFLPGRFDIHSRTGMVGVTKEDLEKAIKGIKIPAYKSLLQGFLNDPVGYYIAMTSASDPTSYVNLVHDILDSTSIDRVLIYSLPDYFRSKLERTADESGLTILESKFRGVSLRLPRSIHQQKYPDKYQFTLEQGSYTETINPELGQSGSTDVIEKASIQVFVAQKPAV